MKLPTVYDKIPLSERYKIREEYIKLQGGRCYHCNNLLSNLPNDEVRHKMINRRLYPPSFFKHPVHLHHNHVSGMPIGAVHNYCNAVLWEWQGE